MRSLLLIIVLLFPSVASAKPGFWTGLILGGGAAYLATKNSDASAKTPPPQPTIMVSENYDIVACPTTDGSKCYDNGRLITAEEFVSHTGYTKIVSRGTYFTNEKQFIILSVERKK
jgi:hypothetical protein